MWLCVCVGSKEGLGRDDKRTGDEKKSEERGSRKDVEGSGK